MAARSARRLCRAVALPAGRHEVRLENPELGQTHRTALQVKAGEAVVLKHSFLN